MIGESWFEVVFDDGVRMNTPARNIKHAREKAPKYHKAGVKQVRSINEVAKKNDTF